MNRAARRLHGTLRERGLSLPDLANETGINIRTLRNVVCGNSESRIARQKITDALSTVFWKGVHPKQPALLFPAGMRWRFPNAEDAQAWGEDNSYHIRIGRDVIFVRDMEATIHGVRADDTAAAEPATMAEPPEIIIDDATPKQLANARRVHAQKFSLQ